MAELPRIGLMLTGGTIDSVGKDRLDLAWYMEAGKRLGSGELLAQLPELKSIAQVKEMPFRRLPSQALVAKDWLDLVDRIESIFAEDQADGIVITHGTNTLEETAFFLNLTLGCEQPVVLVGAQRPASALGTDAGTNLVNALQVAGSPDARGLGVLVVLNNEIHPARDVVKTSTYRVQTFRSFDFGALGHIDGDGPHFYRAPLQAHMPDTPFAGREIADLPRVDIVYSYAGAAGDLVRAAVAAGARGLVSAGFAPGSPSPDQREAFIQAAKSGVVVVQCSRAASGRVAPRRHLREVGFVAGEDFSPQKARILLMLMLTTTSDIGEIQQAFQTY